MADLGLTSKCPDAATGRADTRATILFGNQARSVDSFYAFRGAGNSQDYPQSWDTGLRSRCLRRRRQGSSCSAVLDEGPLRAIGVVDYDLDGLEDLVVSTATDIQILGQLSQDEVLLEESAPTSIE